MIRLDDPAYFASGNALNKALPREYQVFGPYRVLSDRMLSETYINYLVAFCPSWATYSERRPAKSLDP